MVPTSGLIRIIDKTKRNQMKKELERSVLEPVFKDMLSLSFAYLDKAVKELQGMDLSDLDKADEAKQQKFNLLHTAISIGLDLTHRSYPFCYDLFPENKENLDKAYGMFKRFEKAKLLKECPCTYCKENPVKIETTDKSEAAPEADKVPSAPVADKKE